MKENYVFYNFDTKKDITIPLGKNDIIYIYGGNGSGKTTFSRKFKSDNVKSKVFNEDFINENVFITDSSGAKIDANTKGNFSKLFVSEDAVKFAKEMTNIKELNKAAEISKQNANSLFLNKLGEHKMPFNQALEDYLKDLEKEKNNFDYQKSEKENKDSFTVGNKLETSIENYEEFTSSVKRFLANDMYKKVVNTLKESNIFRELFISKTKLTKINQDILEYNKSLKNLKDIEGIYQRNGVTAEAESWIIEGLKLHEGKTKCIFCSNDNIGEEIKKWIQITSQAVIEQKRNILQKINEIRQEVTKIVIHQKSTIEDMLPKTLYAANKILLYLGNVSQSIQNTEEAKIEQINIEIDDIALETDSLHKDIINYIINENIKEYLFSIRYTEYLKNKQVEFESLANVESEKFAESTKTTIQRIGEKLGLTKEISILSETRKGSTPKLSLSPSEKGIKIGDFSEGQRHKLALAIFFAQIIQREEKIEYLVLDDPIISLDTVAYHKLKSYVAYDLNEHYTKLIVLTHNLAFLLVMISNVFRNRTLKNMTTLLEINPQFCMEIPLETIAKDDIVLFRNALRETVDINDVSLWYWAILKLARYFLDLKLSLSSIVSFDDVTVDLQKLYSGETLAMMKSTINIITKVSKSPTPSIGDIIRALESLNKFVKTLGFPEVIEKELIIRITNMFSGDEKVIQTPKPKNIEFKILHEGFKIIFDNTKNNDLLRNYLMHPKHQITDSLIAFHAERDS